jgi:hypothetical protein
MHDKHSAEVVPGVDSMSGTYSSKHLRLKAFGALSFTVTFFLNSGRWNLIFNAISKPYNALRRQPSTG